MHYFKCDACDNEEYTEANPFVELRTARPSDPTDLVCVLAGCSTCFPGAMTPKEWEEYADETGYLFLS